tara:strand:- start:1913 stop:2425 length:513 start_codon:yes stop_codon:yes gene_type:complete
MASEPRMESRIKKVYVKSHVAGSFQEPLGAICTEDTPIVDFVAEVFNSYGFKELLISTVRCYIFRPDKDELVRVSNTSFLTDDCDLYVCGPDDQKEMLKYLKKENDKLRRKFQTSSRPSVVKEEEDNESCVQIMKVEKTNNIIKKPYRSKTTMDRFQDHMQKKDSPTYNK